jgi:phosphoribosylamine--glycine ligase
VAGTAAEAREALELCLVEGAFGDAGAVVLVEEGLAGREVSLLAVCDGQRAARFPAARDYKPIGDGNTGPNTGGMGSVSPIPDVPDGVAEALLDAVHRPVVAEMARRGIPFQGVLYAGLMMTADGPRVLEFNVRFGDPETQALLPRVDCDLLQVLAAAAAGALEIDAVPVRKEAAVTVVLAAPGYPAAPRTGDPITGLEAAAATGAEISHAGTALDAEGRIVTAGGRVLGVTALGADTDAARAAAYAAAAEIAFPGLQMRGDIAAGLQGGARG